MRFADHDPVVGEAERSLEPFYWSDLLRRKPLTNRSLRVIDAAKQFQLHDGYVAPMRSPNGETLFILFAGSCVDCDDPYARAGTRVLSSYYGRLGDRLYRSSLARQRSGILSERQRQCLSWARNGKSSRDIGEILGISALVVDEHIAKACDRLKVRTRVQAILEAGRRGIEL
jgi:DNA-binding CsgD family transcriptional regulator